MREFYASAKGPNNTLGFWRARSSGSARCRKICSLKRHVPFDALYIIHKVASNSGSARARARRPIRKKTLSGSISRPGSDNLPDIGRSRYLLPSRALIDYTRPSASISTFVLALTCPCLAPTHVLGEMKLLSAGLRHFVSVVSRLLRFTVDASNNGCTGRRREHDMQTPC